MTPTQKFDRDGYTVLPHVYSPEELASIQQVLASDQQANTCIWSKDLCASSHNFLQFATHPKILEALKPLLGKDIILWGGSYLERIPGEVHPWHTDIESSRPEGGFVSVWIGLEGTNQDAALKVVPGSHYFDQPLQKAIEAHDRTRTTTTDDDVASWARKHAEDDQGIVQPEVGNGDAIFFDGRLWHGSNNQNTSTTRTAFLFQYARANVPVRIPDFTQLSWPFRFLDVPKPPCITVYGDPVIEINNITESPPKISNHLEELGSKRFPINLNATLEPGHNFQPFPLTDGKTPNLQKVGIHYSVLAPGNLPHPPHLHVEEEILIVLKGSAHLQFDDGTGQIIEAAVSRGDCIYYPAFHRHSIRNSSTSPVLYLMFKWVASKTPEKRALHLERFRVEALSECPTDQKQFHTAECFTGATDQLKRLHSHVTTLLPGGGYDAHADEHDVAIILFEGDIETNGQRIQPGELVWHSAGIDHDMRNNSQLPARYLVIEFYGVHCTTDYAAFENPKPARKKKKRFLKRLLKNIKRLFGVKS